MHLQRPTKVVSHVYDSTLFDHLDSTWRFQAGPVPGSCWLDFDVDFAFKSPLYRHIALVFFDEARRPGAGWPRMHAGLAPRASRVGGAKICSDACSAVALPASGQHACGYVPPPCRGSLQASQPKGLLRKRLTAVSWDANASLHLQHAVQALETVLFAGSSSGMLARAESARPCRSSSA